LIKEVNKLFINRIQKYKNN